MTARTVLASTVTFALTLCACGGGQTTPGQPSTAPEGSAKAAPAASASSASNEKASTGSSDAPRYDVAFIEQRQAPPPDAFPKINVDVPGYDMVIPAALVPSTRVRFKVTNFEMQPKGSYVQFILDNQPATPVPDVNARVNLLELGPGGKIEDGEHILSAIICRKTGESVKHANAIAVRRFWTGKKAPPQWNSGSGPLMVVGHPYGTYKGDAANDILVDWFLVNMPSPGLDPKGYSIRAKLTGPGIEEEGITRRITDWKTHIILSAQNGTYTLQMELKDKNGEQVPGPGNAITRTFTVEH